ncbi:hypothetical protein F5X96DRAFT_665380 [Biscogniauxia mediterranea]|nr:hypothetical protein F5X96DRAFT_665380 [Biscogniauxia mediterranea]
MSSSGSRHLPPLLPRSPRPGSDVPLSPYEHQAWNFPPPPPGPPPRNLGLPPGMSSPPPPIPLRPPDFEISGLASMGLQLPPPGSTAPTYTPPSPPRPQQQQQNIPGIASYYSPAEQPS